MSTQLKCNLDFCEQAMYVTNVTLYTTIQFQIKSVFCFFFLSLLMVTWDTVSLKDKAIITSQAFRDPFNP